MKIRSLFLALFVLTSSGVAEEPVVSNVELCRRMYAPVTNVHYADYHGAFLVDTGASRTHVSSPEAILKMPDPAWEITTARVMLQTGMTTYHHIHGIRVRAFNSDFRTTDVFYSETGKSRYSTTWTDGTLGVPQFSDGYLRINLRDCICSFHPGDGGIKHSGTVLKFRDRSRLKLVPEVTVKLPRGAETAACFDTGSAFFMTFSRNICRELVRGGFLQKVGAIHCMSAGQLSRDETFILRSVTIGGYAFRDVLVLQTEMDTLGCEFIDCFDTTIDFPKREIWLKPLETEWPLRIPPDASGLILSYRDTDLLLVVRMEPESAALRSGLLVGDRVLSFDSKSPKDTSMRAMRKKLTEAGTTVKLKILRDGTELDIDLPLSRSYEYPPKWPELNTDADDFFKSLQGDRKPAGK